MFCKTQGIQYMWYKPDSLLFMTTYRVFNDNLRQLLPSHLGTVLERFWKTLGAASFPGALRSILPIRNLISFVGSVYVLMNLIMLLWMCSLSCPVKSFNRVTWLLKALHNQMVLSWKGQSPCPIKHCTAKQVLVCFSCWFCLVKLLSLHCVEVWSVTTISYSRSCFKYQSHLKHKKYIPSNWVSVKHLYLMFFLFCIWNPDFFLLTAACFVVKRRL